MDMEKAHVKVHVNDRNRYRHGNGPCLVLPHVCDHARYHIHVRVQVHVQAFRTWTWTRIWTSKWTKHVPIQTFMQT
jgi:hypothetical protein